MWEFTDDDLGLTCSSQPTIIQLNDGSPGVVVGNGYNNTGSGRAALFVINAQTGALLQDRHGRGLRAPRRTACRPRP